MSPEHIPSSVQIRGLRCVTVEKSCTIAVVKIKPDGHWHSGDWIYFRFEAVATGSYLIAEAIKCTKQWQYSYKYGRQRFEPGSHEYNAARKHAIKSIEQQRRKYGDQGQLL